MKRFILTVAVCLLAMCLSSCDSKKAGSGGSPSVSRESVEAAQKGVFIILAREARQAYLGQGVKRDGVKALGLYEKSCKHGDGASCVMAGRMHYAGYGVDKVDTKRALALYESACKDGKGPGCAVLARLHLDGVIHKQDATKARAMFELSCKAGQQDSCVGLGLMRVLGLGGLEKSQEEGLKLFEAACAAKEISGCRNLTVLLMINPADATKSRELGFARDGCEGNDGESCALLSWIHELGLGVEKDKARAAVLMEKACELGHGESCGVAGEKQTGRKRIRTLEKGCDFGGYGSCVNLVARLSEPKLTDEKRAAVIRGRLCGRGFEKFCSPAK